MNPLEQLDHHKKNEVNRSFNKHDDNKKESPKKDQKFDIYFEKETKRGILNVKLLKKYLISCPKIVVY
ncbi:MAG: hypothetical protein QW783_04095 [Candidatus Micrarchaeia archaeon]